MTLAPRRGVAARPRRTTTRPVLAAAGRLKTGFFSSFGVRFGVRGELAGSQPALDEILPPGTRADGPARARTIFSVVRSPTDPEMLDLYRGDELLCTEHDRRVMRRRVGSYLRFHVAVHSRRRVFIHAGAVAIGGRGVLIPGDSFHGKSTLVAELVRAGATYYSDDYAVLDGWGRLHPFAKPISLRTKESTMGVDHPVSSFGGEVGTHPIAVGAILITKYEPGADWQPIAGSAGDGALALLQCAVGVYRRPHATLAAVERAASASHTLSGPRGEAADVATAVMSRLS